jgi:hypothetical protein
MEVEFIETLEKKQHKLTDEEKNQNHKAACKKYYLKNKEYLKMKNLKNYYNKKNNKILS